MYANGDLPFAMTLPEKRRIFFLWITRNVRSGCTSVSKSGKLRLEGLASSWLFSFAGIPSSTRNGNFRELSFNQSVLSVMFFFFTLK